MWNAFCNLSRRSLHVKTNKQEKKSLRFFSRFKIGVTSFQFIHSATHYFIALLKVDAGKPSLFTKFARVNGCHPYRT